MSIGARSSIVATIITLLFSPVWGKNGEERGHSVKRGNTFTVRCVPGKPIPATPLAKRIGIDGDMCAKRIVRKVHVKHPSRKKPAVVVCPSPLIPYRGGCAVKGSG